jgi:hypothetical protein
MPQLTTLPRAPKNIKFIMKNNLITLHNLTLTVRLSVEIRNISSSYVKHVSNSNNYIRGLETTLYTPEHKSPFLIKNFAMKTYVEEEL